MPPAAAALPPRDGPDHPREMSKSLSPLVIHRSPKTVLLAILPNGRQPRAGSPGRALTQSRAVAWQRWGATAVIGVFAVAVTILDSLSAVRKQSRVGPDVLLRVSHSSEQQCRPAAGQIGVSCEGAKAGRQLHGFLPQRFSAALAIRHRVGRGGRLVFCLKKCKTRTQGLSATGRHRLSQGTRPRIKPASGCCVGSQTVSAALIIVLVRL